MMSMLEQFQSPSGGVLFTLSLLMTRGIDTIKEDMDDPSTTLIGQFAVVGGVCAAAYAFIHPLETLKNCAQAGLPRPRASLAERVQYLGGPRGLYRGALPSILCGGLRNGCATVAMNGFANPLITRLGLRET